MSRYPHDHRINPFGPKLAVALAQAVSSNKPAPDSPTAPPAPPESAPPAQEDVPRDAAGRRKPPPGTRNRDARLERELYALEQFRSGVQIHELRGHLLEKFGAGLTYQHLMRLRHQAAEEHRQADQQQRIESTDVGQRIQAGVKRLVQDVPELASLLVTVDGNGVLGVQYDVREVRTTSFSVKMVLPR